MSQQTASMSINQEVNETILQEVIFPKMFNNQTIWIREDRTNLLEVSYDKRYVIGEYLLEGVNKNEEIELWLNSKEELSEFILDNIDLALCEITWIDSNLLER